MSLIINSLEITRSQGFEVSQTFAPIGGRTIKRLSNGAAVSMSNWRKLSTDISGYGYYPPGLDAINWDAAITVSSIARRSISSASNVIALPGAVRSELEYAPDAAAIVSGELVPSPVSITTGVATITTVSGSTGYFIQFFPILSLFADLDTSEDDQGRVIRWTIRGVEV
jgi:hypothetical protein